MKLFCLLAILTLPSWSQTPQVLDIDLGSYCHEEEAIQESQNESSPQIENCVLLKNPKIEAHEDLTKNILQLNLGTFDLGSPTIESQLRKKDSCMLIYQLSKQNTPPIELKKIDENKNPWVIRFHFGFSRTKYWNTDMKLKSDRIDVMIKDFEFEERTTASFYNPSTWQQPMDALRWIDEPTNQFIITAEKNKNVFFLTVFHPKYLKEKYQTKHVSGVVDGVPVNGVMPIHTEFDGYNKVPGELELVRFENTHKQMTWQLGYGREFNLYKSPNKKTSVTWTPQVQAGIMTGQHFTVYEKKDIYWDYTDYTDKKPYHGVVLSAGQKVEVKHGKVSVFVDQKLNYSKVKHGFADANGSAEYNMLFMPVTFGIGIDLYKTKK